MRVALAPRIKLKFVRIHARLLFALALPCFLGARESVCLKTGFCLEAESHIIADGMLVIQSGGGSVQFPADQLEAITALPPLPLMGGMIDKHDQAVKLLSPVSSEDLLIQAALRHGLEPNFVRSVAMVESGLRQDALSPKGALGLMQLMPFTAGKLGVDPKSPDQNAMGGAAFLRCLLLKYKGDSVLALAAYNAGPGAVEKYKGVPPYLETRRYIIRVLREYQRQQSLQQPSNPPVETTVARR